MYAPRRGLLCAIGLQWIPNKLQWLLAQLRLLLLLLQHSHTTGSWLQSAIHIRIAHTNQDAHFATREAGLIQDVPPLQGAFWGDRSQWYRQRADRAAHIHKNTRHELSESTGFG